jgi:hypothetical protein
VEKYYSVPQLTSVGVNNEAAQRQPLPRADSVSLNPEQAPPAADTTEDLQSRFRIMMLRSSKELEEITHSLSDPSKMPCHGYSIPAQSCKTGSKLRKISGSICSGCYAHKGRYGHRPVQACLNRRLLALNHPDFVPALAALITKNEKSGYFRWHDSGDLQSVEHLRQIVQLCEFTPHIKHWLPTREYRMVAKHIRTYGPLPSNLTVRLSALIFDQAPPAALAKRVGVQVSGASKVGKYTCIAPKQNGKCGDCRACWVKEVFNVTYAYH